MPDERGLTVAGVDAGTECVKAVIVGADGRVAGRAVAPARSAKVNAVVYFRIVDPEKAVIQVDNVFEATSQLAQTTLRSVLGQHELDEMLAERDKLNADVREILDAQTDAWGIKVANVEIKHVDLDESMIRAIARQAEAERVRRAKVIHAEGEMQAAEKLTEAAYRAGKKPLRLSGLMKVAQGVTTIEEVLKVAPV